MHLIAYVLDRSNSQPISMANNVYVINMGNSDIYTGQYVLEPDGSWRGGYIFDIGEDQGLYQVRWAMPGQATTYRSGKPYIPSTSGFIIWEFALDNISNGQTISYSELHAMDNTFPPVFPQDKLPIIKQLRASDLIYSIENQTTHGFDVHLVMGSDTNIRLAFLEKMPFINTIHTVTEDISGRIMSIGGGYKYTAPVSSSKNVISMGGGYRYTSPDAIGKNIMSVGGGYRYTFQDKTPKNVMVMGGGVPIPNYLEEDFTIDVADLNAFNTYYPRFTLEGETTNATVSVSNSRVFLHPDGANTIHLDVDISKLGADIVYVLSNLTPTEESSGWTYIPMMWSDGRDSRVVIDYYPYNVNTQNKVFVAFLEEGSWTYGDNMHFPTGFTPIDIMLVVNGFIYTAYYKVSSDTNWTILGEYTYTSDFFPVLLQLETIGLDFNIDKIQTFKGG